VLTRLRGDRSTHVARRRGTRIVPFFGEVAAKIARLPLEDNIHRAAASPGARCGGSSSLVSRGDDETTTERTTRMKRTAIRATNLLKSFGEGVAKTIAVRDASFEANFGEILFIVGPSGSGKTTLLSIISGILRPNSGNVTVAGTDIWDLDANALAGFRLNKIGFVFQEYHLFPRLTTLENVAIPLILKKLDWDQSIEEARKYLEIVGLSDRAELPPVKLSGGEQQRVAIARAVVSQPDILVLDEPTASLDGETGRRIITFVKEKFLNDARCILIVTHDARIYEFADRIMHMEDGAITGFDKGAS
jgi:putative ABC transport system ATP-binding protein